MKTIGITIKSLFVSETWWGWPFKLLFTLLSFATLPLGAALWGVLAEHGSGVLTARAGRAAAKRHGLDDAPMVCGSGTGFLVDKDAGRLVFFSFLGEEEEQELRFENIDSWEWQWLERNGVRTENKLVFKTLEEERPLLTVGQFTTQVAQHWHERLRVLMAKPAAAA